MSLPVGRWLTVAKVGEIAESGVKVTRIGDQEVAIFHVQGGYYAIDDICTHDGGELASGTLEGTVIECPRHGARFDVRTGAVLSMPAVTPVNSYDVRIKDGEIQIAWGVPDPERLASDASDRRPAPGPASPSSPAASPSIPPPSNPPAPGQPAAQTSAAATSAPSQQEMAIRSALETVMDPEINLSVIDLGLIREIEIQPARTTIRMMLTTPFCPYAPQMIADVKAATQSVVPQDCEVEILPDAWSPDLMPDPGLLGYSF